MAIILGAQSNVWTQLTLPNPPAGVVPFVYSDNTTIAADTSNFVYNVLTATLNMYGMQAIVNGAQVMARTGKSVLVPLTGFAYTFPSIVPPNGASNAAVVDTIILEPAGLLATGTITAPLQPVDGQEIRIFAVAFGVTALTVLPNIGQTLHGGAAFALAADTSISWTYHAGQNSWFHK